MYHLFRPILFKLSAETAHDLTMAFMAKAAKNRWFLAAINRLYGKKAPDLPTRLMGLNFRHPIGLAAGLDKRATAFKAFSALGFSSIEMGTVTPKPQAGNDKPRMFRLTEDSGIINRMGFNSSGLDRFLDNIDTDDSAVAGINIGKNKTTPNKSAMDDYLIAMQQVYKYADYITVNISSPNTQSLRDLQAKEPLDELLGALKAEQTRLQQLHNHYVPIALKIAPDLNSEEIKVIATLVLKHRFDALIASNTTLARPEYLNSAYQAETGGLSGAPIKSISTTVIAEFYAHLKGDIPIIGVGGIETADDAWEKLIAGADYLQIYSGLIYHGPTMIREIVSGLKTKVKQAGHTELKNALVALRNH